MRFFFLRSAGKGTFSVKPRAKSIRIKKRTADDNGDRIDVKRRKIT